MDVMVQAQGVHKRFGRLEVLKGIDLAVNRGEVMCMLGPSGLDWPPRSGAIAS